MWWIRLLSALPNRVTIELTNRCNRNCKGCPRHQMRYPEGDMPLELFDTIVEQLPLETVIVPFFRGESLLHPRFADAMEKLQKFSDVQLATNGDLVTHRTGEAILNSVSFLSLSLHTYTTRPMTGRTTELLHAANSRGIDTQVSIVDSLLPKGESKPFAEQWLPHVDRVRIYKAHSHNGFGSLNPPPTDDRRPCRKPWTDIIIYWNGTVALCNHDWDNRLNLGNASEHPLHTIWRSKNYIHTRVLHMTGNRRMVKSCRHCDHYSEERIGTLYTH